ncbi:hypothetical protein N9X67_04855 [Amylibacter sp.]|nr:hypothetical protein [Amylibacter sp.]
MQIENDFLSSSKLQSLYEMVINSNFRIGWEDSHEGRLKQYSNLHSLYSFSDFENTQIIPYLKKFKSINIEKYDSCVVNLTKTMDVNFIHTHPNQNVFLLYCNLTWNPEWGGETIFYKDNKVDILETNPYISNRAIFFDGEIPHIIKSQNILGPVYRFTLSVFFNK